MKGNPPPLLPFKIVGIIASFAICYALLVQIADSVRKTPGAMDASKKQQELALEKERMAEIQHLKEQAIENQKQLNAQKLQADIELQKLDQSRPVELPRVTTNATANCEGGFKAVNLRQYPGVNSAIAYQLPCGAEIYATGQIVSKDGSNWELSYYGGLAGWIAISGIQRANGNQSQGEQL